MNRLLATLASLGVAALSIAMPATATAAHSAATKQAHHFDGTPTVGALFTAGSYPIAHICTASVVRSKSRNVIVTAAHCVRGGSGKGYVFAPGYRSGLTPYGTWHVTASYGAKQWIHQRATSTKHDYAFLTVANEKVDGKTIHLQDVTGGNPIGAPVKPHQKVTVAGYIVGVGDKPITCTAPAYLHHGYPAFNCGGYTGGVSGSGWLRGHGKHRTLVGVLGGLRQGGCSPTTSYSSPLGKDFHHAFQRAVHHRSADRFPYPPSDGC